MLLVKDRQILGTSACVLVWVFPCYMEYYQPLDYRWENTTLVTPSLRLVIEIEITTN